MCPEQFIAPLRHVTRKKAAIEDDGVDAHFVNKERITSDYQTGRVFHVEQDPGSGDLSALSFAAVDDVLNSGRVPVLILPVASVSGPPRHTSDTPTGKPGDGQDERGQVGRAIGLFWRFGFWGSYSPPLASIGVLGFLGAYVFVWFLGLWGLRVLRVLRVLGLGVFWGFWGWGLCGL